jgi:putative zinc finger/helix-turn-helix YgiT family protein
MKKRTNVAAETSHMLMTCFECGQEALGRERVRLEGERHGELFSVETDGYRCHNCGFETVDSQQSAEFTRLLSDAYRAAHGYLTSTEVRDRRNRLGMTQQEFSEYLGTGVASVKRWESGQIQERAMDELIRLKTDPEAARKNLRVVERQFPEEFVIYDGELMSLTMAGGRNVYVEQLPMTIESVSIPGDIHQLTVEVCVAA